MFVMFRRVLILSENIYNLFLEANELGSCKISFPGALKQRFGHMSTADEVLKFELLAVSLHSVNCERFQITSIN